MTVTDPVARLRLAADELTRRAAETPPEPWASPHVRATLVPWVALMGPDLAEPLAGLLRAEADRCEDYAAMHVEALAFADLILGGVER